MWKSSNKCVGITLGDPAGIGPEVAAKALDHFPAHQRARFKIIGEEIIFQKYFKKRLSHCKCVSVPNSPLRKFHPGQPNRETAQASLNYLNHAIQLLKEKEITALVTAPVSKEGICELGMEFHGHTEYLAAAFGVKHVGMMFVSPPLKTILVTRHIPIRDVPGAISRKNIYEAIRLAHRAFQQHFHIRRPRIAVCGLNPHAGEGGTIGQEERIKILPAVRQAQKNGMLVSGPLAADTLFSINLARKFDVVIAMYHDQGLIPVKTLYFGRVVNLTIGLPFVRTSPAHGTAFDIAGKNRADPSSMREAISLALQLS